MEALVLDIVEFILPKPPPAGMNYQGAHVMSICGAGDGVNGLGVKGEEKHWNDLSECCWSTAEQAGAGLHMDMTHTLTHTCVHKHTRSENEAAGFVWRAS